MEDKPLKDSGSTRTFPGGAVRDAATGKGRFDLLPMTALELLAKHYEKGAIKYGENNWRKGMPISAMLDSGMRHLAKAVRGDTDEDHLVAAAWNIMCAIETIAIKTEVTISAPVDKDSLERLNEALENSSDKSLLEMVLCLRCRKSYPKLGYHSCTTEK